MSETGAVAAHSPGGARLAPGNHDRCAHRVRREGYARAGIDAIAGEAGVSTRTIYNHFLDKAQLFRTVIQESTVHVAEAKIAIISRCLDEVTDFEADLIDLGQALSQPMSRYAEHFSLVRQVNADSGHIPREAIEAWQEAGPARVRRELAARFRKLSACGLMHTEDPDWSAPHFMTMTSAAHPAFQCHAPTVDELPDLVAAGVRTFLHGHLNREARLDPS
ncbi:TetR/AcrR family transcriptional regulator [Amycolatopsis antarctica]|uniref:TetR/AcrR family transcriptional regulator n=1 Tax=Amycolatopsis antarctica TaxID=1854586 RepID=UPI00196A54C9|nr:TetR/AcrR family transcriptional regulator [Amycolatopsis antarctica]